MTKKKDVFHLIIIVWLKYKLKTKLSWNNKKRTIDNSLFFCSLHVAHEKNKLLAIRITVNEKLFWQQNDVMSIELYTKLNLLRSLKGE